MKVRASGGSVVALDLVSKTTPGRDFDPGDLVVTADQYWFQYKRLVLSGSGRATLGGPLIIFDSLGR